MKKDVLFKKIAGFVAVLLISASAFGKGNLFVSSYLQTDYAIVSAQSLNAEVFKIRITDSKGETLYASPRIKSASSFQKLFDLSSLADGEYQVILSGKNTKVSESFSVENHKLVSSKDSVAIAEDKLNAYFRTINDKLYVSHLNFLNDKLAIKINNDQGTEVWNSELPTKSSYSGLFDISNLPSGNYQVSLTSGEKVYSYDFRK